MFKNPIAAINDKLTVLENKLKTRHRLWINILLFVWLLNNLISDFWVFVPYTIWGTPRPVSDQIGLGNLIQMFGYGASLMAWFHMVREVWEEVKDKKSREGRGRSEDWVVVGRRGKRVRV